MSAPQAVIVRMTTTVARKGEKRPAIVRTGWHYTAAYFTPFAHQPGDYDGQRADVYYRDGHVFALDLDLYRLPAA